MRRAALLGAVLASAFAPAVAHADVTQTFRPLPEPDPGRLVPDGRGLAQLSVTLTYPGRAAARSTLGTSTVWRTRGPCRTWFAADGYAMLRRHDGLGGGRPARVTLVDAAGIPRAVPVRVAVERSEDEPTTATGSFVLRVPGDVLPGLPQRLIAVTVTAIDLKRGCDAADHRPPIAAMLRSAVVRVTGPFVVPPPEDLPPREDPRTDPLLTIAGTTHHQGTGTVAVPLGDVDGDGRPELAVDDRGGMAAVTLRRSRRTVDLAARRSATVRWPRARSIAAGGDADGDGLDDAVLGEPWVGKGAGRVRVWRGRRAGGPPPRAWLTVSGPRPCAGLGVNVDAAGDVDGDGRLDVLAVSRGCGKRPPSKVWLVFGGAPGDQVDLARPGPHALRLTGPQRLGPPGIAGVGDVDGDGLDDLAIGARRYALLAGRAEGATVLLGSRDRAALDPRAPAARAIRIAAATCEAVGAVVAPGGDVNGDGHADVLLSSENLCDASPFPWGGAYVLFGGPPGTVATTALADRGLRIDGLRARGDDVVVASTGDQDGDGLDDVLVGEQLSYGRGTAFLVPGRLQPGTVDLRTLGGAGRRFGPLRGGIDPVALAAVPDVDGDGRPELAFGTPEAWFEGRHQVGRLLVVPSARR